MQTSFQLTYSEIRMKNKDIKVLLNYAPNCTAYFIYAYNSVGNSYYGLMCDSFVENIRGLLKVRPEFFEQIDCQLYEKALKKMGFIEIAASKIDIEVYQTL